MELEQVYAYAAKVEDRPYDEQPKFEDIVNKRSQRQDLHAFLLIDELDGGRTNDIVQAAEHDQIWIGPNLNKLAPKLTPALIEELIACGVMFSEEFDSLSMFA